MSFIAFTVFLCFTPQVMLIFDLTTVTLEYKVSPYSTSVSNYH